MNLDEDTKYRAEIFVVTYYKNNKCHPVTFDNKIVAETYYNLIKFDGVTKFFSDGNGNSYESEWGTY